jgi:tetratricopeptide (TPR) repeat protein
VTVSSVDVAAFEKVLTTDTNGEFKVLLLDATRRYQVRLEAPGYQSQERPFKVDAGSSDSFFEFTLATAKEAQAASTEDLLEQPGYKEMIEGRKLYQAGDVRGALAMFEAAFAAKPDLAPAIAAVADIRFDLGEYEAALDAARTCLEIDADSLDCLGTAANAAGELGNETARTQYLARYRELNPEDPAVLFNSAAIFLNKLDDEGARPLLEQCLESDPDFPQCNFEYGMLLLRAGDMEGAKKHLEKYLEVAPDGSEADMAHETLKYL